MRALTLAVLKVLRLDEVDTGVSPLLGERVCVVHVHVDGSAAHALRIDAGSCEMDRQIVAMGERIPLVMMRGTEPQLLVVGDRPRDIRDGEDRLDNNDAWHTEIIRVGAYSVCRVARASGNIPARSPTSAALDRRLPRGGTGSVLRDRRSGTQSLLDAVVEERSSFGPPTWRPRSSTELPDAQPLWRHSGRSSRSTETGGERAESRRRLHDGRREAARTGPGPAMSFHPVGRLRESEAGVEIQMTEHGVGTRDEWLAARKELLDREKELTRRSDELARRRQALPWVAVETGYSFETGAGTKTLVDLFGARSQLLVTTSCSARRSRAGRMQAVRAARTRRTASTARSPISRRGA